VVIGGGVVGLSIARELALLGAQEVTVLERDTVGSLVGRGAATCASLGVLSLPVSLKTPLHRLQALGHRGYKDFARTLLEETGIDIGYRAQGGLRLQAEVPRESTRTRLERSCREPGVSCRWISGTELRDMAPAISDRFPAALYFPDEAVVHPPQLVKALKASCEKHRVEVRERAGEVRVLNGEEPRVELQDGEAISGRIIVLAAGAWSTNVLGEGFPLRPPVEPILGQAMEVRLPYSGGPNLHFKPQGLDKDYHLVPKGDGTAWVGATVEEAGFRARVTRDGSETLLRVARELLPGLAEGDLVRVWAGLRPRAQRRGGPFLGRLPGARDVWVATGHYRGGILIGPASARLLAAEIAGDEAATRAAGFDRESWAAFRVDR
jgi:glycine oxidase